MDSNGAMEAIQIQRQSRNTQGRDLIVGDLHGEYDRLMHALAWFGFDASADRLLSTGDLIDRGPDSLKCLRLIDEPWLYATLGNHEDMLLRAAKDMRAGRRFTPSIHDFWGNGGTWLTGLDDEVEELLLTLATLPHLRVIGEGAERFHLVHAELTPETTDAMIDAGLPSLYAHDLTWTRNIMKAPESMRLPPVAPGLSPTFCGHTPSQRIRQRLSHICLDTGAVYGGVLSFAVAERGGGEWWLYQFAKEQPSRPVVQQMLSLNLAAPTRQTGDRPHAPR